MTDFKPITTLQLEKLSLFKEAENGKWKPKLTWAIRKGYPRIIVYTNSGGPEVPVRDTIINAPMDFVSFEAFVAMFRKAIAAKSGSKFKMDCFNAKWEDGKPTNERYLQASIIVGKDDDGIIWISVIEENKAKLKFEIGETVWHHYYNNDGSKASKAEVSVQLASGLCNAIEKTFSKLLVDDTIKTGRTYGGVKTSPPPATPEKTVTNITDLDALL